MKQLTKGEIFILDWRYRLAGDFFKALAEAICCADTGNLDRLSQGFPDEVKAYHCYNEESGWWKKLQDKAKGLGWDILDKEER